MIGVRLVVRDAESMDYLGECHAPAPIDVCDVICLEFGAPLRIAAYLPVPPDAETVPVTARPAALAIAAR